MRRLRGLAGSFVAAGLLCVGCSSAYYAALETIGIEKREILVDRVEAAQDAQKKAQTQFRDALQQLKALVGYDGGELESMYESLRGTSEASAARAREVRDRVAAVQDVAGALFQEWEGELQQYSDPGLRRKSQRQLAQTRVRYNRLAVTMDRAAARMDPVLAVLHDQVLFLKHNLNASALGALEGTSASLQHDVDALIADMQAAIVEGDRFIGDLTAR